jgi:hypothetical protein
MRILLAFRVFFLTLFNASTAARIEQVLNHPEAPTAPTEAPVKVAAHSASVTAKKTPAVGGSPPAKATRSEALTLLATLQREARFVDFMQESLSDYSDAQVGAAVRDVHRDCAAVLDRMFALKPLLELNEGETTEVPEGFQPARIQLSGNVTGQAPYRGTLRHHGWEATQCELPTWSGSSDTARVVAPAEIEIP